MRDILIYLIVFGSLPFILARPYVGVLMWSWIGYMNPHRLAFGSAYDFPFALIVGALTLVGIVFSSERKRFPLTKITIVWLLFIVWLNVTTLFALVPGDAWLEWDRAMKIQFFSLVTVLVMQGKARIHYLVWIITASIGFFAVKGGIFSIMTGGSFRIYGPPGSFIEDNNDMALAIIMILPLMWYIGRQMTAKTMQVVMLGAVGLSILSVLTSQSRGALLALVAALAFFWFKSRKKIWLGIILVGSAPIFLLSMPDEWHERMSSISEYRQDESAMGRINAWHFAYNLAIDRPLVGGGFQTFDRNLFSIYAPDPRNFHDAHSIYFEVLAEQGFVGLILFLSLWFLAYQTAGRLIKDCDNIPQLKWAQDMAAMLQASLVGYATGGLFLGLAYFDLYYHLIAIVVLLGLYVDDETKKIAAVTE